MTRAAAIGAGIVGSAIALARRGAPVTPIDAGGARTSEARLVGERAPPPGPFRPARLG